MDKKRGIGGVSVKFVILRYSFWGGYPVSAGLPTRKLLFNMVILPKLADYLPPYRQPYRHFRFAAVFPGIIGNQADVGFNHFFI